MLLLLQCVPYIIEMGFRFSRRINLGKGFGLNISKSGISPSLRTKFGSVSGKGFSVRSGLPGLGYSKRYGKSSGCMLILMSLGMLFMILIVLNN